MKARSLIDVQNVRKTRNKAKNAPNNLVACFFKIAEDEQHYQVEQPTLTL